MANFYSDYIVVNYLEKIVRDENGIVYGDDNMILREALDPLIPELIKFNLEGVDLSIVNGLRRIVMSEVESLAITDVRMNDTANLAIMSQEDRMKFNDDNITIFNTEFLKDRTSMIPIHIDSYNDMDEAGDFLLCLCGDDANYPIINDDNENHKILAKDITILKKILPEEEDEFLPFKTLDSGIIVHNVLEKTEEGEITKQVNMRAIDKYRLYEEGIDRFIKYPDMIVAEIKKGESLFIPVMKLSRGSPKGSELESDRKIGDAKWMAAICRYTFDLGDENNKILADGKHLPNPIDDIQNYPRVGTNEGDSIEKKIWGHFDNPKKFNVELEYNGHMNPLYAWKQAISILEDKIVWLKSTLKKKSIDLNEDQYIYNIEDENNNLRLIMELFEETPGLVKLTILNEDHTLGNIIRSHFLYQMELELFNSGIKGENFVAALQDSMSQYKIPHPLDNKLEILLKVPSVLTLDNIKGKLDYKIINDNFITYRNTLVLLDHVLNNINIRFVVPLYHQTSELLRKEEEGEEGEEEEGEEEEEEEEEEGEEEEEEF